MLNYDGKGSIRIGSMKMRASRWPWQAGCGWLGMKSSAPLNTPKKPGGLSPRFGGGWSWKLGFALGGKTLMIDLLFGSLFFTIETAKDRARAEEFRAWQRARQEASGQ